MNIRKICMFNPLMPRAAEKGQMFRLILSRKDTLCEVLTLPMLRLLSSKAQGCKVF